MNDAEIIEANNNLLAEFMEYEVAGTINDGEVALYYFPDSHPNRCGLVMPSELSFTESYDVFMWVWFKFRNLRFDEINEVRPLMHIYHCVTVRQLITEAPIEEAFQKLVDGVKWYKAYMKEKKNNG